VSSLASRITARAIAGNDNPQRAVFSPLVCLCDDPEVTATRTDLWRRVQAVARDFREKDLRKLMAWLRRERRGYSREVDGPSPLMTLLDSITALEDECMQAAERRAVPSACAHCGATNGEHKSHGRYRCMGGTFSLSDKDQPNA
jgi:hypothetical protein